ncbi:hypothetical protein LX36DRAFT_652167, partial [Colletotrichum falcatum]
MTFAPGFFVACCSRIMCRFFARPRPWNSPWSASPKSPVDSHPPFTPSPVPLDRCPPSEGSVHANRAGTSPC